MITFNAPAPHDVIEGRANKPTRKQREQTTKARRLRRATEAYERQQIASEMGIDPWEIE